MHEDETLPPESLTRSPVSGHGDTPTIEGFVDEVGARRGDEGELLGRRLGRYLIMRTLGEGGMGRVYEAYDEELDRRVAIKRLHAKRSRDEVQRARMQREARAMAKISHPHVVAVYDVGTFEEGDLFVAMEFVRGQTLRQWQAERDPTRPRDRRELLEVYVQAGQGLAAAHEHGLVHRDFKPDNVIVGEDGRARVLDFGLVTPTGTGREDGSDGAGRTETSATDSHEPLSPAAPTPALTRAGSMMGTPLFMAAEQFLGEPSDERTDQFNFCAALYHALYGVSAFEGDSVPSRMAAVLHGRLRSPPAGREIPDWLRAVVLRGLAREPDERHPSMAVLLSALSADPIARRRRRLVRLAAVLAVVGLSVAVVLGGLRLRERWRQQQLEDAALDRLAALDAAIEQDPEQGRTAFDSFVRHPDNWGTRALALAWLHEAERAREQPDARIAAYAQAYVVATEDETRREALLGLARHFRRNLRWPELARALALLDGKTDPDGELSRLRLDSMLARREFGAAGVGLSRDGARSRLRPVVEALGRGAASEHDFFRNSIVALRDDPLVSIGGHDLYVLGSSGALEPVSTSPDSAAVDVAPGAPGRGPLIVGEVREPGGRTFATLSRLVDGRLVELFRWEEQAPLSAVAHDLDGDGAREVYVGTGPYTRRLVELVEDDAGGWSTRSPSLRLDRRGSDFSGMAAADLDGDGREELVVAHGPWTAFELRVLRRALGAPTLDSIARARIGHMADMELLDHRPGEPGGVEIMVLHTDFYRPPAGFVPAVPEAAVPGLLGFRLREGQLELTRAIPAPELDGGGSLLYQRVFVADLDGDGHPEVILTGEHQGPESASLTSVYALAEDGGHAEFMLSHVRVRDAVDVDGDGDDELLVYLEDEKRSWILGTGDETPPALDFSVPDDDGQEIADPVLARMWRRAEDLGAMGLDAEAAESFVGFAAQTHDPALEARALLRAAELLEAHGDDLGAARLYVRAAHATARPDVEAARTAVRTLRRRGELRAGLEQLESLAGVEGLESTRAELERLVSPTLAHTLDFDAPIPRDWRIDAPLHLSRDRLAGTLRVGAHRTGTLLTRPVRWDGEFLMLEVDLDIERAGWGSNLEFRLVDGEGEGVAILQAWVTGGSSDLAYKMRCLVGDRSSFALSRPAREGPPARHTLRLVWDRPHGTMSCSLREPDGRERFYARFDAPAVELASSHALELRGMHAGRDMRTGLSATLHSVSATGVELSSVDGEPASAAIALVEGDHLEVLRGTEAEAMEPEAGLWRVVALARLSRMSDAAEALARLVEVPQTRPQLDASLVALLRSDPQLYGALIGLALGHDRRIDLLVSAWSTWFNLNPHDAEATRVMLDGLADLGPSPSAGRLELRARVHQRVGDHGRAAADLQSALDRYLADEGEGPFADDLRMRIAQEAALAGDMARARALVAALLASPEGVERNAEAIADSPRLAPLAP